MSRREENGVDHLFGLAKNERLIVEIVAELAATETRDRRQAPVRKRTRIDAALAAALSFL
ncbi:hypothetical protein SAMN05519104_8103 [Rhizobiales bacterium GAS188]|nr:hypothetical protein SAMN05519104_8103 [Rhizobiales bacterium GAS188]